MVSAQRHVVLEILSFSTNRRSWFRILAHRSVIEKASSIPSSASTQQKAIKAANRMVQLVESLLTSGKIQHCSVLIIPALFAAMSMLVSMMRSGNKISQQVAYAKCNVCMIALHELQGSWPISGWIILLFEKIVRGIQEEKDHLHHQNILIQAQVSEGKLKL